LSEHYFLGPRQVKMAPQTRDKEEPMTKRLLAVAFLAAGPLLAAEPAGFVVWKDADLKAYGPRLSPKIDVNKVASERLATFGNHLTMIGHREGDGEAELHDGQADYFVVQSGEATLVVGGAVVGGRTTAPGEIRGASIRDGARRALAAGDIVHIPARTPHQLLLAPGKHFTYFVIKVDTP
jgi:mannose-6-phosphate isomerase-like protein (cupin superfamily)